MARNALPGSFLSGEAHAHRHPSTLDLQSEEGGREESPDGRCHPPPPQPLVLVRR